MAPRVVLTLGTFDMLHPGHLDLLRACRGMAGPGGTVVASVNPDDFVERFKGRRPIQSIEARIEVLRACRYVDAVVVNVGQENAALTIDVVRPDLLAIGDDWADRDYLGQLGVDEGWMARRNLRVEYVPRVRAWSTTAYRAEVAART